MSLLMAAPPILKRAAAAGEFQAILDTADIWLTPRTGDGNNTYREDTDFFLSAANDHSGNGRHFTQTTEADQFTRLNAELNSLPVWGPSSSNRGLIGNTTARNISRNVPSLSVASVVFVPDVTTTHRLFITTIAVSGNTRASADLSGGTIRVNGRRLDTDNFAAVAVSRSGLTGVGFWIFEFDWAANRARAYRNNTLVLDGAWLNNASAGQNSDDSVSNGIGIGQHSDSAEFWAERIAEIAAFRRILTTEEKTTLWAGLGQGVWGLS